MPKHVLNIREAEAVLAKAKVDDFVGVSLGIRDSVLFVSMAGPEGKNQGLARSPTIYASIPSHLQRTKNVFSLGAATPVEPVLIEATQTTRLVPIFAASNRIGRSTC